MAQHAATTGASHDKKVKSRYIPALDGLRAFAVLAVIVYHMKLGWAPGGLMGVTVFFVISGYLINGLLVAEHDSTGTISLKSFWMRRIRRLFPAIFLSVAGTAALCTLFDHTLLDKMRPDILPSLLFFNNWWQIFRDLSYFEAQGDPSPLAHFWSLSIEEQFYLVWPLLLLVMYRAKASKQTMARTVLVLAIISALEMALLYDPHGDPSRIYYGTDTRAMSLLVGVLLAFMWPSGAFGTETTLSNRNPRIWGLFNAAGITAFAGLIIIVVFTNGYSAFPYYGGIALTSALSAVVIAVLVVPRTWLSRLFELSPLVWIGKRSYGMYLWHFPILLLTTNVNSTVAVPWWMRLVQLALIFGISELSYRFVEDPIRKGKIGEWWRTRKDKKKPIGHLSASTIVPAGCFVIVLIVACIGVFVIPPTEYAQTYAGAQAVQSGDRQDSQEALDSGGEGAAEGRESGAAEEGAIVAAEGEANAAGSEGARTEDGIAGAEGEENTAVGEGESAEDGAANSEDVDIEGEKTPAEGDNAAGETPSNTASTSINAFISERFATAFNEHRPDTGNDGSSGETGLSERFTSIFNEPRFNAAGEPIYEPLLIGDSVSAGAIDMFYAVFPYGHIDAVVSRNIWENPYQDYLDADQVGEYVVFCLGTNNAVVDWQVDGDLLGPVSEDKKVFIVNTRNTCDWLEQTNRELAAGAERHPNVTLIDWYGASEGHDEYFGGDGTHLTPEGAEAYIGLIHGAIEASLRN